MEHLTISNKLVLLFMFILAGNIQAQDSEPIKVFLDTRIVNGHSVEMNPEGVMKFIIGHRFGNVSGGISELYGLDQSTIRIGFDYGIKDWLGVGVGRSSFQKTVDGYVKINLLKEGPKALSVSAYSDISINTTEWVNPERENLFTSRVAYAHQLLVAKKVSDNFSAQIMPSLVHRNLVPSIEDNNDVFSVGVAARYKISKMIALSTEYYYVPDGQLGEEYTNSLAIGIEVDTKGHVFQMHFGNSRGMIEKFFITETTESWGDNDFKFGFNITRDFKLKGRNH